MSRRDGPTQRREAFHFSTRDLRRGWGVFLLSGPIRSWWPSKGSKDIVGSHSQKNLVFLWLFVLFEVNRVMLREQEKLGFNLPQMKCDECYYVWKEKQRGTIVLICKVWAVSAGAVKACCCVWVMILTEGTLRKKKAILVWNKPKK